jgi:transposase
MVGRGISVIKLREMMMILDLHRQGLSVSAIARQAGIDRKTVRKYIERGLEAPVYGPRKPRATVIDPFAAYLRERVKAYPGLTARRLFREIKDLGYSGGYTALTDFLRDIRPPSEQGFEVRFETPPGEQAQVDFAQFHLVFTDEPTTPRIVWLFSMVLGYSRLIWARFVMHQNLPTVLRCHVAAFEAIGGAPREILYDRMKTAVIGEGETAGIVYNRALVDLARHYGFHPRACRPYRAKTKGKVERPFRYIREDFFLARSFRNLDDLNAQLRHWLDSVANPRTHATTLRVVNEAFAEERPHLRPLPLAAFPLGSEVGAPDLSRRHGQRRRQCLQCSRRDPQPDGRSPFAGRRGPHLRERHADRRPPCSGGAQTKTRASGSPSKHGLPAFTAAVD